VAADWVGLTLDQLAVKVRESAATTAAYYKSLGLNVEVWEIGNETDFGLCGIQLGETAKVPPGVDWTTDTGWMHDALWSKMAVLMKAAIEGIRSVYPDAKMLLHIAGFGYSPGNVLTSGFFRSMIDSGVPYDIAGLSYPYLVVPSPVLPQPYFEQAEFQSALTAIGALGKRVQIVEFNYPNSPSAVVQAQNASPRYPLTPQGQADFVRDLAGAITGKVESLFYWYPDYYQGFSQGTVPELDSCGLYSANGVPHPALATFRAIADGRIASRNDCLFNWAERAYPQYFHPAGASTAAYGPYTYRRYAGSGNYMGVSSADDNVYVFGPNFGPDFVKLGPAANFLGVSSCS
jgi:arabinogalactan endo-1,4-beta-galactosidase